MSAPAVLAVVVATDGAATLPRVLTALEAQDHENLEVVAVDNGSTDASRGILLEHLGPERVFVADRDLGFGGAVGMALDAEVARGPEYLLFVHDDLALRPDAVRRLLARFEADGDLAVAGCKLVEWHDERQLQAVGMSVDVTGRADPGVDDDELDQGQRDHEDRTLYVSTAGMLVRRDRFEQLGRFDHRYHLFRDDLDLCWRAWLRGWSVEVVPEAVAAHEASASTYKRLGQTAFLGPRYFAERNTLATLLKNYGFLRLLYVLPLFAVVGVAKVLGFIATRRVGDAWQTVRAWAWNGLHLRETWRLRGRVQTSRARTDSELQPLFAQVTARVRAYGEALGSWLSGSSDEIGFDDPTVVPEPDPTLTERLRETLRTSPVGVAAVALVILGTLVSLPLLNRSPLVGGELAAWPDQVLALLRGYVRPWEVGDLPAVVDVDPAQVLFGIPSLLTGASAWAAPKLVVLSLVPIAWASALRAARLVTHRRLPRVAGATLFALSPPMLAALRTGRIGAAIAASLLPLLVISVSRATIPDVPADRAWRATAAAALVGAAAVAFEPAMVVVVPLAAAVAGAAVALGAGGDKPGRLGRLAIALAGAALLLAPWLPRLRSTWVPGLDEGPTLWRLLLLTPDLPGFPGSAVGLGLATAALVGVALSTRRAGQAAGLAAVYLGGVGVAWLALRGIGPSLWPGTPLLVAAMAAAGLLVLAFALAEQTLEAHAFGWRQLATLLAGALVVVGILAAARSVTLQAWDGYSSDPEVLPAFLASEADRADVGPFRTLVLSDRDGEVVWSITDADGPTMASWGHVIDADVDRRLAEHVRALTTGRDPGAAAALGHVGVRYVVVPADGASQRLTDVLGGQLDLVEQPVADGLVLRVTTWLPRWSVLPGAARDALLAGQPLPAGTSAVPLEDYDGDGGLLVAGDLVPDQPAWSVTEGGAEVDVELLGDVATWELDEGPVEVARRGATERLAVVALQGLVLALAVSLALRAPGFARRRAAADQEVAA